jgi:hypothetical protein
MSENLDSTLAYASTDDNTNVDDQVATTPQPDYDEEVEPATPEDSPEPSESNGDAAPQDDARNDPDDTNTTDLDPTVSAANETLAYGLNDAQDSGEDAASPQHASEYDNTGTQAVFADQIDEDATFAAERTDTDIDAEGHSQTDATQGMFLSESQLDDLQPELDSTLTHDEGSEAPTASHTEFSAHAEDVDTHAIIDQFLENDKELLETVDAFADDVVDAVSNTPATSTVQAAAPHV